jgi:hypothetical protein
MSNQKLTNNYCQIINNDEYIDERTTQELNEETDAAREIRRPPLKGGDDLKSGSIGGANAGAPMHHNKPVGEHSPVDRPSEPRPQKEERREPGQGNHKQYKQHQTHAKDFYTATQRARELDTSHAPTEPNV